MIKSSKGIATHLMGTGDAGFIKVYAGTNPTTVDEAILENHMLKCSNNVVDAMLHSLTEPQDEANQFVRDGKKTYMRYDAIQIAQSDAETLTITLMWKGEVNYSQSTRCNLANGDCMTIVADGKTEIHLQEL